MLINIHNYLVHVYTNRNPMKEVNFSSMYTLNYLNLKHEDIIYNMQAMFQCCA